jgi:RNA polymerase sigma factor (sigma-70 family)
MGGAPTNAGNVAWLAKQIAAGDLSAENEFALLFHERIFFVLLSRIGDAEAARELAQDTVMAAIHALRNGQVREAERIGAFLHGIARNLANNYLRERGHRPATVPLEADSKVEDTVMELEAADRVRLVRRELDHLTAVERKILLHTLLDGMQPSEIAERLGLKPEQVREYKSRALAKVIQRIQALLRKGPAEPLSKRGDV